MRQRAQSALIVITLGQLNVDCETCTYSMATYAATRVAPATELRLHTVVLRVEVISETLWKVSKSVILELQRRPESDCDLLWPPRLAILAISWRVRKIVPKQALR